MEYECKDAVFRQQELSRRGRITSWLARRLMHAQPPSLHANMSNETDIPAASTQPSADSEPTDVSASDPTDDAQAEDTASAQPDPQAVANVIADLPPELVEELGLDDEDATRPIAPPSLDFSSAHYPATSASSISTFQPASPGPNAGPDTEDHEIAEIILSDLPRDD